MTANEVFHVGSERMTLEKPGCWPGLALGAPSLPLWQDGAECAQQAPVLPSALQGSGG